MNLGILMVKKVEDKTSKRVNCQEYKVVTFSTIVIEDDTVIEIGIEAERAIFPEWTEHSETYKPDPLYYQCKSGLLVTGCIICFTILLENLIQEKKIVILDESENPYKRLINMINFFPFYLTDWRGKTFKIKSPEDIPKWDRKLFAL
jgi:hypothetical protein